MSPTEDTARAVQLLRARVAELTEQPEATVGTDRSLASLGLESISIIDLQTLIEDQWELVDFPIVPTDTIDEIAARALGADVAPEPARAAPPVLPPRQTFPALPLQRAYLVGRRTDLPLGGVAAHMYLEFDSEDLDLGRAEHALRLLIERHDMLRTVLRSDGTLETLTSVPPYVIPVTDLTEGDPAARLAELREQAAHRLRPADQWPLLDVRAARLDDRALRLFVTIDFVIADAASCLRLLTEWGVLYRDHDAELAALPTTFERWSRTESEVDQERLAPARAYWAERAAQLPPAPELPLLTSPRGVVGARFERRQLRVPGPVWSALREHAAARGLTTSVVLCAAYARVLAGHTARPDFTLTLTTFNRPPVPGIEHVVGDFSGTALLAVDAEHRRTFGALARSMQDRLWLDLQHRAMPGPAVLREVWRARGGGSPAPLMPVVFTSMFEDFTGLNWLGDNVFGVSETPQVYLDHQCFERDGELVLQFDSAPELVPADLLDRMLERHERLVTSLAEDPGAWDAADERTPA